MKYIVVLSTSLHNVSSSDTAEKQTSSNEQQDVLLIKGDNERDK